MKLLKVLAVLVFVIPLFVVSSCKKESKEAQTDSLSIKNDTVAAPDETFESAKDIFYSLPAPHEVSMILLESDDIYYDESKLNSLTNAEKYSTNLAKALNLGIYSADLSYASIYDQNQTVVNYMATAKKLAESLGILEAFNEQTVERLERNFNNRDSIMTIISETYMQSDAYLKENKREEIAALIMIGGWVEGLYLALSIAKDQDYKNELLVSNIIEQELSLQLIMDFLNNFPSKKMLKDIMPDMEKIAVAYKELFENSKTKSNSNLTAPRKYLDNLYTIVKQIRNKYVNMF